MAKKRVNFFFNLLETYAILLITHYDQWLVICNKRMVDYEIPSIAVWKATARQNKYF